MPSTFSNFVSRDPYSNLLGGYVKRPFQIAEDVSAAGATQAYAIDSKPVNLCFAAKLQSGTSAAATIEQSSDGGATWSTVASITLDTVGKEKLSRTKPLLGYTGIPPCPARHIHLPVFYQPQTTRPRLS